MIHLELEFTATKCNSWPRIRISNNQTLIWQGIVEHTQCLDFFISSPATIKIQGIDKCQGENNVWDTQVDEHGKIVADKTLTLKSVRINTVEMGQDWIDRLPNIQFGVWYENISTEFSIGEPILDWIIQARFHQSQIDKSIMYNNFDRKWNYQPLRTRIAALKRKLNVT